MKYLYQVCGKISLLCYIPMLYQLWHLCQYGGMRRHLPALMFWTVLCAVTWILWLVARWKCKQSAPKNTGKSKLYYIEVLLFAAVTVFFCGKIVYSAIPYHGALSWKVDEFIHQREIVLKHNNIFEDGVEGILADLDQKLDLPEELYVSKDFRVRFDADGTVQKISTFLYGKNKDGKKKTYLVDYNAKQSDRMTVWLDGHTNGDYKEDMRLSPMLRILENAEWQKRVAAWSEGDMDQQYELLYAGRRAFEVRDGLHYLSGDVDGDEMDSGTNCIPKLDFGGKVVGFEVSLHIPESESITPVRYIMEPAYITPGEIRDEHMEQQVEEAKDSPSCTVDQHDGSMYFFLNDSLGWRLTVADAAAGSRFYVMERTKDGGVSWDSLNQDPFQGQAGVAEGLMFYDENFGVAGLSGASQASSELYLTRDGGVTFQKIELPMNQVTELPETAKEYGFTLEDYDYLEMPKLSENVLKIKVIPEAAEEDGILFHSADGGKTWTYQGVWNRQQG